jgi:DNA-binding XRE family transcriptional regulator
MTYIDEIRKDPKRNRLFLQETALIEFTCEVYKWLKHNSITMKQLAKKLKMRRKKLKSILNGERKISLRLASDICLGVGCEIENRNRRGKK